jgi:lipopolysaccharide transport system ATP-binding protein
LRLGFETFNASVTGVNSDMNRPAIKADGLWKQYQTGRAHHSADTFYDLVAGALGSPLLRFRAAGQPSVKSEPFSALRNVSFEVQPGEVVGIIGRNGAGKSTLLKILSRITAPTLGRVEVRGRLASLLEVGTGFHPELSGRENIYLNATILGMTRREVDRKFDEIVDFSGVGRFLDTPVKRYSSGMYVRLAFAVAAHVEADILLVDEVLAVGDAEFQKRCLGKMEQVATSGRTVVFVSHNLTAVRNLCTRGLMLDVGELILTGPIETVLRRYSDHGSIGTNERVLAPNTASGNSAYVSRVAVRGSDHVRSECLSATKPITVVVDVEVMSPAHIDVFIHCYDAQQVMVFSGGSFFDDSCASGPRSIGTHQFTCDIPGRLINDGTYALDVMLVRNRKEVFVSEPGVLRFALDDDFPPIHGWQWRPAGVIRPHLKWCHRMINPETIETSEFTLSKEDRDCQITGRPARGGNEIGVPVR